MSDALDWMLVNARVPKEPSRHRVAVWRALRKIGAVPISSGMWALPRLPAFEEGVAGARQLAERGGGTLAVFVVSNSTGGDVDYLRDTYLTARREEWEELLAECGRFEQELRQAIDQERLSFAELEEHEQSLDRLRRWQQELLARSLSQTEAEQHASTELTVCERTFDGYADLVYRAAELGTGPNVILED